MNVPDPRNLDIVVCINGELVPRQEAKVSVFDSVVQGGDAVWEGLRVYDGRIAALETPRKLKLAHTNREVRVELRRGDALETQDFALDDAASKQAFVRCIENETVETIHTREPSLEDVFLAVTGKGLLG